MIDIKTINIWKINKGSKPVIFIRVILFFNKVHNNVNRTDIRIFTFMTQCLTNVKVEKTYTGL